MGSLVAPHGTMTNGATSWAAAVSWVSWATWSAIVQRSQCQSGRSARLNTPRRCPPVMKGVFQSWTSVLGRVISTWSYGCQSRVFRGPMARGIPMYWPPSFGPMPGRE
ncbi:hypothetical protein J6397_29420 [Rhodococcus qingshengii]|uniref:hypothetical protein n=1 Tax=unclassified Rhodococcus (in: high G+C Gram-positive bacteria) TaxID=192944 RepID=UPI000717FD36|nr:MULTISPECIES: hypothetical protein [unclassified Rhodococcus (in: high G+C Gram-positive bacteria)]MBP1054277.1 hypothetical protein [Rhodococcus qingshengii]MBP2521070.1 hypothetical protein [Rhodococcus sp. PvP104]MDA3637763.1 hypothetical protein [Rhodococcus sp. C-2]